jgi:MYXO-CTERM domain-containing protein
MKRPRFFERLVISAVLLTAMAISARADAWAGLEGPPFPHWGRIPVQYHVVKNSFPADISNVAEERILAGFATWSAPKCTYFDTIPGGDLPGATYDINDGKNVILWINKPDAWPQELGPEDSVIGVALPVWSNDGMGQLVIDDADIIFNNVGFCWYDFDPANPDQKCLGGKPVDTLSIVTHEQGHFLGLGHTNVAGATMEPAYLGGNDLATIEPDDIDGVCALYPIGGTMGNSSGMNCESCRQHAAEFECQSVAKACTSVCLDLGDCLQTCPKNDVAAYDACASQCSLEFKDGLSAYVAYSNCLCTICGGPCAGACAGPSNSGNGNCLTELGNSSSDDGENTDCKPPAFNGTGGCGCSLGNSDENVSLLFSVGLALAALSRRRRFA